MNTATTRVPLVGGRYALIDREDADLVRQYRWYCLPTPSGRFYATTEVDGRIVYMHRLIASTPDGLVTDHANNDGLDNRRSNLRTATWMLNSVNTAKRQKYGDRRPTSRFKGVCWDPRRSKWHARAKIDGKQTYLGRYDCEITAARAYDAAAFAAWGEFAVLNFPAEVAA
jgi:hypothetical protein